MSVSGKTAGKTRKETYVPRDLEKEVSKYAENKEIIAVVGPRQSGKTTLLKKIFDGLNAPKVFLSFEDRDVLNLFVNDVKAFNELHVKGNEFVFIDEFQYAKDGGKTLKYLYDATDAKIFISGSSASELSIQSVNHLVGRIFVFTLYPFSFKEFLGFKNDKLAALAFGKRSGASVSNEVAALLNGFYEEYAVYGGYPRVTLAKDAKEKEVVLKNIYNTYLLKEVKEILAFKEDYKLEKLVQALALQVGGTVNCSELSQTTGFNYKELLQALNVLKKTFIVSESKPFHENKRTELVKAPKFFFVDNGFRNCVIKDFRKTELRQDAGALNENYAATELLKSGFELNFWRTKAGAEVDFIVRTKEGLLPIEVKSSENSKPSKSVYSFIDKYKPKKFLLTTSLREDSRKIGGTELKRVRLTALPKELA